MDQLAHRTGLWVEQSIDQLLRVLSYVPGSAILGRYIKSSHQNDPLRTVFELLLLALAIRYFLASKQSYNKRNYVPLSTEETDELIKEWKPEPLVSEITAQDKKLLDESPVIIGANGPHVQLVGHQGTFNNFTSTDMHNFSHNKDLEKIGIGAIRYYGVGSCGPAGFYGHQDAHGETERAIASFLGTEKAIFYAQGMATPTSVIPCFAKRGDVLVMDSAANISLQKGAKLARAEVYWYRHNDMDDLEKQLKAASARYRKKGPIPRRFIVTEGLFEYTANSPDLKRIVELKQKFKFRLLLDESWSLGVLGATGRGLPEEQGVSRRDVDITVATLASAMGTSGGFCAGDAYMTEHQRIVSLAYTFSATCPPYLAKMTCGVIDKLSDKSYSGPLLTDLRRKAAIVSASMNRNKNIELISRVDSPIVIFRLSSTLQKELAPEQIQEILNNIVLESRKHGILISRLHQIRDQEVFDPINAIRLYVPNGLSEAEIKASATIISKAITKAAKL